MSVSSSSSGPENCGSSTENAAGAAGAGAGARTGIGRERGSGCPRSRDGTGRRPGGGARYRVTIVARPRHTLSRVEDETSATYEAVGRGQRRQSGGWDAAAEGTNGAKASRDQRRSQSD